VILSASHRTRAGTVPAEGQEMQITSAQALFSLLGSIYGGNGTSTFRLPDLRGQGPVGTRYYICTDGAYPTF